MVDTVETNVSSGYKYAWIWKRGCYDYYFVLVAHAGQKSHGGRNLYVVYPIHGQIGRWGEWGNQTARRVLRVQINVEALRSSRGDFQEFSWRPWEVLVETLGSSRAPDRGSWRFFMQLTAEHKKLPCVPSKNDPSMNEIGSLRPMTAARTPSSLNHFVITNFARFYIKSARLFMRSNQPGFERISKFCQVLELFAITPHAEW